LPALDNEHHNDRPFEGCWACSKGRGIDSFIQKPAPEEGESRGLTAIAKTERARALRDREKLLFPTQQERDEKTNRERGRGQSA